LFCLIDDAKIRRYLLAAKHFGTFFLNFVTFFLLLFVGM